MLSIILSLHLMLCLMALAPTAILAAPVAHQKVTPPPAANQITNKVTGKLLAVTTPTVSALPKVSIPTAAATSVKSPVDSNGLPAAGGASGPNIVTADNNPLTGLHIPTVESRSAELVAAIRSENSAMLPLTIPATDETGEDTHAVPVVEGRAEPLPIEDIIAPLISTIEDDDPDCANRRGGCNITTE